MTQKEGTDVNRSRKRRRLALSALWLAAGLLALLLVGAGAYAGMFDHRIETPPAQRARLRELRSEAVSFSNGDGVPLQGWLYAAQDMEPSRLVVLAHGMGIGHRAYGDVIAAFARRGYLVFAYDATGYDDSGGSSPGGVPQAVLDLDAALRAAESRPEAAGLPVCLFGHSLGAYAVCAVLPEHPEVRAAAALAGFDSVASWVRARYGLPGTLLIPGAALWERLRFGGAAGRTASEGLASSEARVLIVHSGDDETVPIACGLERWAARFGGDPRFRFLRLERGGHDGIFSGAVPSACFALFDGA